MVWGILSTVPKKNWGIKTGHQKFILKPPPASKRSRPCPLAKSKEATPQWSKVPAPSIVGFLCLKSVGIFLPKKTKICEKWTKENRGVSKDRCFWWNILDFLSNLFTGQKSDVMRYYVKTVTFTWGGFGMLDLLFEGSMFPGLTRSIYYTPGNFTWIPQKSP